MSDKYTFISYASIITGKNIGCCVIKCVAAEAQAKAIELDLEPHQPIHAQGAEMDEKAFKEQGMELNRFYTNEEMCKTNFEKVTVAVNVLTNPENN